MTYIHIDVFVLLDGILADLVTAVLVCLPPSLAPPGWLSGEHVGLMTWWL